jgi:hypothetical protein
MILMWAFWHTLAHGGELRVVRAGETVDAIASSLGEPGLAAQIRTLNQLPPDAEPPVGAILTLPDRPGGLDQPAQVLAMVGSGTARPAGGTPVPLVEGVFLPSGTEVCTGPDSYATLRLASAPGCADEDDVSLLPATCLVVDGNHGRPDRRTSVVSVRSGGITVTDARGEGRVAVRTTAGVTTGEEGGFRVAVEDNATRAEAVTGAVAMLAAGQETAVPAGFGVRTLNGAAPGELVALLKPGQPTSPLPGARLLVPDFSWTAADRALGYRVEIASDPAFTRLVRRAEVGGLTWKPSRLFLPARAPTLHWRIVPFDRTGFEGIPSEARAMLFPRGVAEEAP